MNEDAINKGTTRMKQNADYSIDINNKAAYITENEGGNLTTLNIITATYAFNLHSNELTAEELITIGESIDLSELD